MSEYFHGWKKKVGMVMLVFVSMLASCWIRSLDIRDRINVRRDRQTLYFFESNQSDVIFVVYRERRAMETRVTRLHLSTKAEPIDWFKGDGKTIGWRKKCCGFQFGQLTLSTGHELDVWLIPYWSLVLPPIVVCVWLIFPRRSRPLQSNRLCKRQYNDVDVSSVAAARG